MTTLQMSYSYKKEQLLDAFGAGSIFRRDKEKALSLLKSNPAMKEVKDNKKWTLLHYAARNGWTDVCQQLVILYQVDPHAKNSTGFTALHYACSANHADTVKYLVNHAHCNPLTKNNSGYTPFYWSKGESRVFLKDIIDKAKKERLTVVEYIWNHPAEIDYTLYFERAAAHGTVRTRLSSIGLFGAAGTGKSATVRLLTDQEPVYEHDSTPVVKPKRYYKTTEDTDDDDHTCHADEDSEYDSESDEPSRCPDNPHQHVPAARQDVLIAQAGAEWMPATQEVLVHRFGNCVATLAAQNPAGADFFDSDLFIDGFSMHQKNLAPFVISNMQGDVTADASVTPSAITRQQQDAAIARVSNLTQRILKFIKSRSKKDLDKLGITHFVSMCDTGGQAAFLDIAPTLLSFNSVNLVFLKLTEKIEDPANFFYSVNGKTVGHENRRITTRALVYSMVSSKSKIMPPRIKSKLTKESQYRKPQFMILGTHLDEYEKMKASGKCPQSKAELNTILEHDLSDFKDCIYQRHGKKKMVYTLNTQARDRKTKNLASFIRTEVMKNYVEVQIPASWFIFQLAMLELKQSINEESCSMISLSVLNSIGIKHAQMPPEEVQAALQYFHELRISLYYPTIAPNVVFTDPQFLFDKISEIFALSQGERKNRVSVVEFEKLSQHGKFNKSILGSICKGFNDIFSESEFLSLLCHIFVLSKIPSDTGDTYFMPSLLAEHPNPCAEFFTKSAHSSPSIEPLLLSWDTCVPNGLFTSLTTGIQAAEGVEDNHFIMSPTDEQYRNRITLNCPDLACQVRLIECASFVALQVLRSEPVTNQCTKVRRAVLSCIDNIGEQFNWMPTNPKEALFCKIKKCTRDDIHFCHLDASHKDLSCAKKSSITAPAQADSHLIWWEPLGMLDHELTLANMFKLLQDKSAQWDRIGREFSISNNDRQILLRNPALDDNQRLEMVLSKWLELTSEPTWAKVYTILTDSLQFNDAADKLNQKHIFN